MKATAVIVILGLGASVLSLAAPACSKRAPGESGAHAPPAPTASDLPRRWAALHLPTDGLQKVQAGTDEHGCYIDYAGSDMAGLWEKVSAALKAAGFVPACNVLDGKVRGFARGGERLAVKIDNLGGLVLSIFDEKGSEPLLHGVCFGNFQLGPPKTLTPAEREAL